MINQNESYAVAGKPLPYREDSNVISLVTIKIGVAFVEIVMAPSFANSKRITFEIWEHTIYELETLSMSLRYAAKQPFPQPFKVPTPESWIGASLYLSFVSECEVGYSIHSPGSDRSTFFCSSRHRSLSDNLGVWIGLAIMGDTGR